MARAILAVALWAVYFVLVGIPMLLIGLVHRSPRLAALASFGWARLMLWVCGIRLTIVGREHLGTGPKLLAGNHQSAVDIPIVMTVMGGDVRFLAKRSLFRIPVFGWLMSMYGYIPLDRFDTRRTLGTVNRLTERLRRSPISFAVFPEGTRSLQGELNPFRSGAMRIGQQSGLSIVPFSIDGAWRIHTRRQFRVIPGRVRFTFSAPIPADQAAIMSTLELSQAVQGAVATSLRDAAAFAQVRPIASATKAFA